MSVRLINISSRRRRQRRLRARLSGTSARPRLAVFRSLRHITAQLIDDTAHLTLAAATNRELAAAKSATKSEQARAVGSLIAQKAALKKITAVVFDRGGYRYHGRIKALAEGARTAGLQF